MSASIRVALNSLITQLKACISISGRVSAKKDEERQREREREREREKKRQELAKNRPVKQCPTISIII